MQNDSDKAKALFLQSSTSHRLLVVWLEVKYYPSWAKRDDFAAKWNFGVKDVAAAAHDVNTVSGSKRLPSVTGTFQGNQFEIVSESRSSILPDGALFVEALWLFWNGKLVVAANYSTDEGLIPSQFTLLSVDELHWSDDWVEGLAQAAAAIELHHESQRALAERDKVERERGKFSLPAETTASSHEVATTGSPALDAEWTRIIAKPTLRMTEYDWRFLRANWRYGVGRYIKVLLVGLVVVGGGILIVNYGAPLLIFVVMLVVGLAVLAFAAEAWPLLIGLAAIVYLAKNC